MLEEESVALVENRELMDPKVNVKSYLKNIVAFYKDAADPIDNDKIDRQVSQTSAPEEYMHYSLGQGVQFVNEYDGDEYC